MPGKFEVRGCAIPDVKIIRATNLTDPRGFFSETYARKEFAALGINCEFVQDNLSLSDAAGTVRGLHFQIAPYAQAKLVRVLRGRAQGAALDLRRSSPSFGRHVTIDLTADSGDMFLLPRGFAHAFCTLDPDTLVFYKVDNPYSAAHERGVYFADPDLGIRWPVAERDAVLSERDRKLPLFRQLMDYFD